MKIIVVINIIKKRDEFGEPSYKNQISFILIPPTPVEKYYSNSKQQTQNGWDKNTEQQEISPLEVLMSVKE